MKKLVNLFLLVFIVLTLGIYLSGCMAAYNDATKDTRLKYKNSHKVLTGESDNKDGYYNEKEAFDNLYDTQGYEEVVNNSNSEYELPESENSSEEGLDRGEKLITKQGFLGLIHNPHKYKRLFVNIKKISNGVEQNFSLEKLSFAKTRLYAGDYTITLHMDGKTDFAKDKTVSKKVKHFYSVNNIIKQYHFTITGWEH